MKFLVKYFIMLMLIANISFADDTTYVRENFQDIIDNVLLVVRDKDLTKEARNIKIVKIVEKMFDFELMGKIALGRAWQTLSPVESQKFIELYVKRMENSYSSKLDGYKDEKIFINNVRQVKDDRIILFTSLAKKDGNEFGIEYKLYKSKESRENKLDWLIYDVEIAGVSVLKTDKAQFSEYLKTHTINQLMESM